MVLSFLEFFSLADDLRIHFSSINLNNRPVLIVAATISISCSHLPLLLTMTEQTFQSTSKLFLLLVFRAWRGEFPSIYQLSRLKQNLVTYPNHLLQPISRNHHCLNDVPNYIAVNITFMTNQVFYYLFLKYIFLTFTSLSLTPKYLPNVAFLCPVEQRHDQNLQIHKRESCWFSILDSWCQTSNHTRFVYAWVTKKQHMLCQLFNRSKYLNIENPNSSGCGFRMLEIAIRKLTR